MIEGIYPNISHREYHAIEAVSNSYLSRLSRCPKAAKIAQEETPAMIFGSAFHSLLLEGQEAFGKRFAVAPKIDKRTKQGNEDWLLFAEQNVGKSIITKDDYDKMCEMCLSLVVERGGQQQAVGYAQGDLWPRSGRERRERSRGPGRGPAPHERWDARRCF